MCAEALAKDDEPGAGASSPVAALEHSDNVACNLETTKPAHPNQKLGIIRLPSFSVRAVDQFSTVVDILRPVLGSNRNR